MLEETSRLKKGNQVFAKGEWLDFLLYFFCAFPFLSIFPFPSDTQPYALLIAVVYLLLRKRVRIPRNFYLPLAMLAVIVAWFVLTLLVEPVSEWLMLFRKVYNYITVMVIPLAVYNSFQYTNGLKEKWIKGFILAWLVVGVVQSYIYPNFLGFLVPNFRTSATRGVPGLASEPSFYGYMMVFFCVLASRFKSEKERYIYIAICVLQVIFLAESSVAIVYLLVFLSVLVIKWILHFYKMSPTRFLSTIVLVALSGALLYMLAKVYVRNNAGSRLVQLSRKLISNIGSMRTLEDVYRVDVSVGQRVNAIYTSVKVSAENFFMPHGFVYTDFSGRIMSAYGTALYEFGFIGIYLIAFFSVAIYKGQDRSWPILIGVAAMMFSAVQLASPMFSFLLGYSMFEMRKNRCEAKETPNPLRFTIEPSASV